MNGQRGIVEVDPKILGTMGTQEGLDYLLSLGLQGRVVSWGMFQTINRMLRGIAYGKLSSQHYLLESLYKEQTIYWKPDDSTVYIFRYVAGVWLHIKKETANGIQLGNVSVWDLWNWVKRPPREGETARQLYSAIKSVAKSFDVKPRGYIGYGNLASPILRSKGINDALPGYEFGLPDAIVRSAFFGGRIQAVRIGHSRQPAWVYDLNSAYAWGLSQVPSLRRAEIKEVPGLSLRIWGVYEVEWDVPTKKQGQCVTPIYPFPVRRTDGSIEYPPQGRGWHWGPLVKTAAKWWPEHVKVLRGLQILPKSDELPFSFIGDLYRKRQEMDGLKDKVAKWTLSALWGKLCQEDNDKYSPGFHCLAWAGMATSLVNSRLLDTAMRDPRRVWAFAVDSLITTKKLPGIEPGNDLGEWRTEGPFKGIQLYQPGVYRLGNPSGEGWKTRARGFPEDTFPWEEAEEAWKKLGPLGQVRVEWPEFQSYRNSSDDPSRWLSTIRKSAYIPLRPGGLEDLRRQLAFDLREDFLTWKPDNGTEIASIPYKKAQWNELSPTCPDKGQELQ